MAWKHGLDHAEKVVAEAQGRVRKKKNLRATALLVEIYRLKELPSDMSAELREALEQRKRWPAFHIALSDAAGLRLGQAQLLDA